MSFRDTVKKNLPAYRTEKRINEQLDRLHRDIRETNKKNEFLFWLSQMRDGETLQETKERVFLKMPKATGRLRNIQLAEDFILKRVKKICDENGLQLFLIGGTLLGAIRHKGFIPWDNDVDIGMLQSEFDKLKKLLAEDELIRLEYTYSYTAGLRVPKAMFRGNDVFWIDIFPFDYVAATEETAEQVWQITEEMNRSFSKKLLELTAPLSTEKHCRLVPNEALDREMESFKEQLFAENPVFGAGEYFCEAMDNPYWAREPRGMMSVREHMPFLKAEVEFEGEKYDVPNNYEKALERFFGDYWALPFSISEPHTSQFDEGLEQAFEFIRKLGIID